MFEVDSKEKATGIVEMKNVDAKTMLALIEYLHTESIKNLENIAFELFMIADKYSVDGLKVSRFKQKLFELDFLGAMRGKLQQDSRQEQFARTSHLGFHAQVG